jgi:beta-lactamase class A
MIRDRRSLILALGGLGLASCAPKTSAARPAIFDPAVLQDGFAALARRALPGQFGLGVADLASGQGWVSDPKGRYPMQSVFKAPLAAAILAEVDAGRAHLNETVSFDLDDLSPHHSPLSRAYATLQSGQQASLSLAGLLGLILQQSDNAAADLLLKRLGGPGALTDWLRGHDIDGMRIDRPESQLQQQEAGLPAMRPEWRDPAAWQAAASALSLAERESALRAYLADPRDTMTVASGLMFLSKLAGGELVSPESTAIMLGMMTRHNLAPQRFRAGLPKASIWAHRTGGSYTTQGVTAATNDIGVVTLADGRKFALVGLLTASAAVEAERDRLFADAARLCVKAFGAAGA